MPKNSKIIRAPREKPQYDSIESLIARVNATRGAAAGQSVMERTIMLEGEIAPRIDFRLKQLAAYLQSRSVELNVETRTHSSASTRPDTSAHRVGWMVQGGMSTRTAQQRVGGSWRTDDWDRSQGKMEGGFTVAQESHTNAGLAITPEARLIEWHAGDQLVHVYGPLDFIVMSTKQTTSGEYFGTVRYNPEVTCGPLNESFDQRLEQRIARWAQVAGGTTLG